MNINKKDLIEIVGVASVVASLVFVGVQLYLDRQVVKAAQYHARAELRLDTIQSWFENDSYVEDYADAILDGRRNPRWMTEDIRKSVQNGESEMERYVRQAWVTEMEIITLNNNQYMYLQGLMDEGTWQVYRSAVEGILSGSFTRSVVESSFNTPEMRALISEILNDG